MTVLVDILAAIGDLALSIISAGMVVAALCVITWVLWSL